MRWVITTLFVVSLATYLYILVAQSSRSTRVVNHALHLAMSAAMILMVWRVGLDVPTIGPMIFFVVSGVWFARTAGRISSAPAQRLTNCYYAVMMAAMAWMYALMAGSLPGQTGRLHDQTHRGPLVTEMPAMDMPAHGIPPTAPGPGWITVVNWMVTAGFAAVAVYWPCRYLVARQKNLIPHTPHLTHTELLYQASTAAGTALMFAVTL